MRWGGGGSSGRPLSQPEVFDFSRLAPQSGLNRGWRFPFSGLDFVRGGDFHLRRLRIGRVFHKLAQTSELIWSSLDSGFGNPDFRNPNHVRSRLPPPRQARGGHPHSPLKPIDHSNCCAAAVPSVLGAGEGLFGAYSPGSAGSGA